MLFEHHQKVEFEVSNAEGISPTKANVLLDLFKKRLKELKYQDFYPGEDIHGRVVDVDEFSWQQPMPNLINCRYDICKWDMVDNSKNAVQNYNNVTKQRLSKIISDIQMEIGGTVLKINHITQF
ncbi:MAG: hypothetical protein ISS41_07310 [Candidatus Aminicenantes bacterium]|nr:hypothetical protein [Candidatus Aminicenantes bacterium]